MQESAHIWDCSAPHTDDEECIGLVEDSSSEHCQHVVIHEPVTKE